MVWRAFVAGVVSLVVLAGAAPAPAAVLHRWEAEGNALDAVGTAHGTLMGDTGFAAGHVGQAFAFDGSGDYVSVATAGIADFFPGTASFTVDAWASTSASGSQPIVAMYECAGFCSGPLSSSMYTLGIEGGQATTYLRDTDNGGPPPLEGQGLVGGPLINDGALHHVGVMRDVEGSRLVLFVDGVAVADEPLGPGASGAISNLDPDDDPFTIGGQILGGTSSLSTALAGRVDDARISSGATSFDTTPPAPVALVSGPVGDNGWYTGDVQVTWNLQEPSVIRESSGCAAGVLTADTPATAFTCTATSVGGTGSGSVTVRRDASSPQVSCPAAPSFEVGTSGSITATVSDGGSGPQADKVTVAAVTTKTGGGSVSVTGRDVAGNTTTVACAFTVTSAKVPAAKAVSITSIATLPPGKACVSRRKFPIRLRGVRTSKIVRAQIKLNGKQVRNVTGKALSLPIDLRGLPKGRFVVEIVTTDRAGKRLAGKRTYRTCVPKRRS